MPPIQMRGAGETPFSLYFFAPSFRDLRYKISRPSSTRVVKYRRHKHSNPRKFTRSWRGAERKHGYKKKVTVISRCDGECRITSTMTSSPILSFLLAWWVTLATAQDYPIIDLGYAQYRGVRNASIG